MYPARPFAFYDIETIDGVIDGVIECVDRVFWADEKVDAFASIYFEKFHCLVLFLLEGVVTCERMPIVFLPSPVAYVLRGFEIADLADG
jgi:hypothetical protein